MAGTIEGSVVSIAANGNLVSDISAERLRSVPDDSSVTIRCDEHETNGIFGQDHQQPDATLIALIGHSGSLELEIVGREANLLLGIQVGEKLVVRW